MRCLIVADLHYSLPQYDWLVAEAAKYDIVIIAGDHLDLSAPVDGRAQIVVIGKYLELLRARTRVITCSGNHDLDSRDGDGEKTARWISALNSHGVPADGQSVTLADTLISICPWWDGPLAQKRLADQLARDAAERKPSWVWVHHAPAADSPVSWSGSRFSGDTTLLDLIRTHQPDLVFSGHIHQSPFTKAGSWIDRIGKTWVFNVGQHLGVPPAHIVYDSALREVVWFSMAGIQAHTLKLAADEAITRPLPRLPQPPGWFMAPDQAPVPNPVQNPSSAD